MKLALGLLALCSAGFGAYHYSPCSSDGTCRLSSWVSGLFSDQVPASEASLTVAAAGSNLLNDQFEGHYVEARSASVYAGACHYNGEYTTQGRLGVWALMLTGGEISPEWSLSQDDAFECVVALGSAQNLDEGEDRSSVLFLPEDWSQARCDQAQDFLSDQWAEQLGELSAVQQVALKVDVQGEQYNVQAGDAVSLQGECMASRDCCKMPNNVWYRTFLPTRDAIVGTSATFSCSIEGLAPEQTRSDENNAFVVQLKGATQSNSELPSCCQVPGA